VQETIDFVRSKSRPWIDSDREQPSEGSFTIAAIGDLEIRLHAAEAILERAGRAVDAASADPNNAAKNRRGKLLHENADKVVKA
jgi:hypothetical protein